MSKNKRKATIKTKPKTHGKTNSKHSYKISEATKLWKKNYMKEYAKKQHHISITLTKLEANTVAKELQRFLEFSKTPKILKNSIDKISEVLHGKPGKKVSAKA